MKRLLLALAVLLCSVAPAAALDPFRAAGIDREPGAAVPLDFVFQDQTGAAVTLRQLLGGRPMLLVPVQHQCPNICGVTLATLLQAIGGQTFRPGKDFSVVAFGIDPKEGPRDAASALGRLLAQFPAFPRNAIHGLTGKADDIAAVTKALGYRYAWDPQLGQYDHVAATAVLSADGHLTHWLYGIAPEPADLKLALTEAGRGQIGDWTDQIILLCYHYDPVTGRYGSVIWIVLRSLGVLTLVALLGLIGLAFYRERHPARGGRA